MDLDPGDVGLGPHPLILPDVILPDPDIHVAPAPAALVETVRCGQDVLSKWVGITYFIYRKDLLFDVLCSTGSNEICLHRGC